MILLWFNVWYKATQKTLESFGIKLPNMENK